MADKMIWTTFQREGIHLYPGAEVDPKLATGDEYDVGFLGVPHRHLFKFKVWIEVFHDDRDIEFIQFSRWLSNLYGDGILELNHRSCEMISDEMNSMITEKYPNREVCIEVSEDGENGSFSKYDNKD